MRARRDIFKAVLRSTLVDDNFDYIACAKRTEQYSPSDIVSVCKVALQAPTKEYQLKRTRFIKRERRLNRTKDAEEKGGIEGEEQPVAASGRADKGESDRPKMRPLQNSDVENALKSVYPTQWIGQSYGLASEEAQPSAPATNQMDMGGGGDAGFSNNNWWTDINQSKEPEYDEDDEYSDEDGSSGDDTP